MSTLLIIGTHIIYHTSIIDLKLLTKWSRCTNMWGWISVIGHDGVLDITNGHML